MTGIKGYSVKTFELSFEEPTRIEVPRDARILDVVVDEKSVLGVGNSWELRRTPQLPILGTWDAPEPPARAMRVVGILAGVPLPQDVQLWQSAPIGTCLDATGARWWFFAIAEVTLLDMLCMMGRGV